MASNKPFPLPAGVSNVIYLTAGTYRVGQYMEDPMTVFMPADNWEELEEEAILYANKLLDKYHEDTLIVCPQTLVDKAEFSVNLSKIQAPQEKLSLREMIEIFENSNGPIDSHIVELLLQLHE